MVKRKTIKPPKRFKYHVKPFKKKPLKKKEK
jgi:hypothetical protein